ncbi:MAG: tetratricopeptide repeat protein [Methylocystis sp.]
MFPRMLISAAAFVLASTGASRAGCLYKPFEFFPDKNDEVIVGAVVEKGTTCQHKFKEGKGYRFTSVEIDGEQPPHGALKKVADREFIYTPNPEYVGDDIYAFKICAVKGKKEGCSFVAIEAHVRAASRKQDVGPADCKVGDPEKAIAACGPIVDDAKRTPAERGTALKFRGMAFFRKGGLDAAEADFSKAAELDPNDSEAFSNRGLIRQQRGDIDKAIAHYDKAIALQPKQAAAYVNRAFAWRMKGDLARAIADATQAIALQPSFAGAYKVRADLYRSRGEAEKARADDEAAKKAQRDQAL